MQHISQRKRGRRKEYPATVLVIEGDPFVRRSFLRLADETETLFVVETFEEALDLFDGGALFDDILYPENPGQEAWLRRRLCRRAAA